MATKEEAVRNYLTALKEPESLIDSDAIEQATSELEATEDPIERLKLRQRLQELQSPTLESVEDEFVTHAKAWAEEAGIDPQTFAAEGVSAATLRRAGFSIGRSGSRGSRGGGRRRSSRTTTEEVIEAMPGGSFTVKQLREISGASPAVVRKAIAAEVETGHVAELGPDPDHSGPGRAPTLYRKG